MPHEPNMLEWLDWLGISGLVTAIGAAIGFGKLHGKIANHDVEIAKLQQNSDTLTRLDERVMHIKADLSEIKEQLRVFSK